VGKLLRQQGTDKEEDQRLRSGIAAGDELPEKIATAGKRGRHVSGSQARAGKERASAEQARSAGKDPGEAPPAQKAAISFPLRSPAF